jgi:RHS repeat-associated protein
MSESFSRAALWARRSFEDGVGFMKRTVSVALCLVMLLGAVPATAAPGASGVSAGRRVTVPVPAAAAVPVSAAATPVASTPLPRTAVQSKTSSTSDIPADPRQFGRHHAPLARPTRMPLAQMPPHRAVAAPKQAAAAGLRLPGPPVSAPPADMAAAVRDTGANVVRFFARPGRSASKAASAPKAASALKPASGAARATASGARTTSSVDITALNATGINPWWSYEEGAIPGVGRWMINAYQRNLIVQADDMDVPYRGIDLAFRRTYNSLSDHDYAGTDGSTEIGQYGNGWTNTFDAHISTNGCPNSGYAFAGFYGFSVYDVDGARYDYCFNASGALVPPPGMQGTTLAVSSDGGAYYWTKKSGTQYVFYAPYWWGAYAGRIDHIAARNVNNTIRFAYAWSPDSSSSANLTNIYAITDSGMQATLTFAMVGGQRLLSQLTRPDGSIVTYAYDAAGNLVTVSKPAPNDSGTPLQEQYGGYRSSYMTVANPRWYAGWSSALGTSTDGGYVAFHQSGLSNAQVDWLVAIGVMNSTPADSTNTQVQPGVSTAPMQYWFEQVTAASTNTAFSDSDGRAVVQYLDTAATATPGRPTVRQEYTGSQWLQTMEGWDAGNDLTSATDARGNETDFAYDASGNTIAVAAPQVATSEGTFRPTKLYDYDAHHNVTAYCDETQTHRSGGDWVSTPVPSDTLCSARGVAHATFGFENLGFEPFGQLTSMTMPSGYRRRLSYASSQQHGNDYGLPTSVTGDPIAQANGTTITPQQTFWYTATGQLGCYSKGNGTWVLGYDAMSRLLSVADPDDASANGSSVCGKTSGQSGWNTQTTYAYYPDGSRKSAQTPSERAYGVSTTYAYDADHDLTSETAHHGCAPNSSCPAGTTRKWYDGADRLVEVMQPHDPRSYPSPPAPAQAYDGDQWSTRYLYDLTAGGTVAVAGSAPFRAYGNLYKTQTFLSDSGWTDVRGSQFDALDREIVKYTNPTNAGVSMTQLQYDAGSPATSGLLTSKTNPNGESVTYTYDARGHVAAESYAGDQGLTAGETYTYDADGRTAQITSSQFGAQQYQYDDDGRLLKSIEPSGGGLTSPATITYGYYGDGKRSSVSVASSALTQTNALAYSYRADGLLQTQAVNATASGTWSKAYTDAGRLTGVSGSDTQTKSYDTAGQLTSHTLTGGSLAYTRDPEGSAVTEVVNNSTPAITSTIINTVNVRGELIDVGNSTDGGAHQRTRTNSGCLSKVTIPADLSTYDSTSDTSLDPASCDRINGLAHGSNSMSTFDYNGSSWSAGDSQRSSFDATGRETKSVSTHAGFGDGGKNDNRPSPGTPAVWVQTQGTVTTSFDAENHTRVRTHSGKVTRTDADNGLTTTTTSGPTSVSIGWGSNGHPVLVPSLAYAGNGTQYETLHWDGDMVLFVTDAAGNLTDFKAGLDGDITPRDSAFTGLTVYDRDDSGTAIESSNSTGNSGVNPIDQSTLAMSGAYPNMRMPVVEAQYLRPDGFLLDGLQINGVRAYNPSLGAWTTPDAYEGDIHDPASQQKYMWNRGNPVDYSDSSGFAPCDDVSCAEHADGKGPPLQEIGHVVARTSADQLMPDGRSIRQHVASQRAFTGALSEAMFWVLPGGAEARFAKAGIELSEHAVVRLAQRSDDVTVDAIIEAYKRGRLFFDPKYRTFIRYDSKTGTVVAVDKIKGGKILTIMQKDNSATRWNPVPWRPGQ